MWDFRLEILAIRLHCKVTAVRSWLRDTDLEMKKFSILQDDILIYTTIYSKDLKPFMVQAHPIMCHDTTLHMLKGINVWVAAYCLQGCPTVTGLSFNILCPSIHLSAWLRVASLPSPSHTSLLTLFDFYFPLPTSRIHSRSPPHTAERHPASHNSSLEPSRGPTAASCNKAKSNCNQIERAEPKRRLAQSGK